MFTGIVMDIGQIESVIPFENTITSGVQLHIKTSLNLGNVALGDSIAIQGACMTITKIDAIKNRFTVDVSHESLLRTTGFEEICLVNLEKALGINDVLGGHIVLGHVDGVGKVIHINVVGKSKELYIVSPNILAPYIAYKGSITINGVSLTINQVEDKKEGCVFSVNLIPHTLDSTTLNSLKLEDLVNIEIDALARYVHRNLNLLRMTKTI